MRTRAIEFVIDEVVLRGVPPQDRYRVLAALQKSLNDLARSAVVEGHRWAPDEKASRRLSVSLPDASPATIGTVVATSFFSAVGGEG